MARSNKIILPFLACVEVFPLTADMSSWMESYSICVRGVVRENADNCT